MFNMSVILEESSCRFPERTALVCDSVRLTYRELQGRVNQLANGLRSIGIKKGDRILMACPNCIDFVVVYYAILKIGAIAVTVNILSKQSELIFYLEDTEAKVFFCDLGTEILQLGDEGWAAFEKVDTCEHFILTAKFYPETLPYSPASTIEEVMADQPVDCEMEVTNADDTAVILYTSGTTGKPKGAELTHHNIFAASMNFRDAQQATKDDVYLVALPLFHCYAQEVQMNCGFLAGATVVLLERFEANVVLKTFEQEDVSLFAAVPTIYWALLNQTDSSDYDIEKISSNLRLGMSGGAAMPVEVMKAVEEKFKFTILEAWGLTESAAAGTLNQLDKQRKIGSIGTPHWGIKLRVVDENMQDVPLLEPGELVMQAHCVMKGYYNQPEATEEAFRGGWLHTGDVATKDEDGYFYIVDRLKDMIIRGGYNVYPREVEERMMEHPAISLVAVIGVPDEKFGEEIKAYVLLNDGVKITEQELIDWSKKQMAGYKYPRVVKIVESLPMSATGKILKKELRKMV